MANRVLSERIKTSPSLSSISFEAASAFLWALTEADPLGRMQDSPDALAYALFAQRPDVDSLRKKMVTWITEWAKAGLVIRYEASGRKCLQIVKWSEYQRIHDGAKSKYPDPPQDAGSSGALPEDAGTCCSDSVLGSVPESVSESPKPVATLPSGFVEFWNGYPRKVGKGDALKAWTKLKPDISLVLKALKWQKVSDDWLRDGGRFIPHPATYLNARRWEDENALEPRRATQTNRDEPDYYQRALDAEKARLMQRNVKPEKESDHG